MRSIARRIYHAIALVSLVSLSAMLLITFWVSEDLENTMLRVELAQERDFFLAQRGDPAKPLVHSTPALTVAYIPLGASQAGTSLPVMLPEIFKGLPQSFVGELYREDGTFLVSIEPVQGGVLYLARNISHFEDREWLFRVALFVVGGCIAVLSIVLAIVGARRVIKPLSLLADKIHDFPVGAPKARLDLDWQDAELTTIAMSFNAFIQELETYVQREKALLGLASHELRTPIAVIAGALDVMEQRNTLTAADQKTLARIRRATEEMQMNVGVLLTLARKPEAPTRQPESLVLKQEITQVLGDLGLQFPVETRIHVQELSPCVVTADAAMVRMLLRNLIQNALQHTSATICLRIQADTLDVVDEGPGLTPRQQAILNGQQPLDLRDGPVSGLGLYLVTLMTERLGWSVGVVTTSGQGTCICLNLTAANPHTTVSQAAMA